MWSGRADLRPERAYFRPEKADLKSGIADLRPERADLRPEKADLRSGGANLRADLRPGMARGGGDRTRRRNKIALRRQTFDGNT